jgi:hypothetical protein
MTDVSRPRALSIAFAVGAVLALGAAVGGVAGCHPCRTGATGVRAGRVVVARSRALLPLKVVARQDLPALLALWAAAPLLLALLLAWPLAALRDSGSLAAVLGLSVLVSAGLLAAWRTWPLWNDVERLDGSLAQHWQALAGRDLTAWRGLGVAALVIALAALVVLPAWPGLLPEAHAGPLRWRWWCCRPCCTCCCSGSRRRRWCRCAPARWRRPARTRTDVRCRGRDRAAGGDGAAGADPGPV